MSILIKKFSFLKKKNREKLELDKKVIPVIDNQLITLSDYLLDKENNREKNKGDTENNKKKKKSDIENKKEEKEKGDNKNKDEKKKSDKVIDKFNGKLNVLKKKVKRRKLRNIIKETISLIKNEKISGFIFKKKKASGKDSFFDIKFIVKRRNKRNPQYNDETDEEEYFKYQNKKQAEEKSCVSSKDSKESNINGIKDSDNKNINLNRMTELFNDKNYRMREIKKYKKFFIDDRTVLLELLKMDNKKHVSEKLKFKKEDLSEKENRSNSKENSFINKNYKKFNKLKMTSSLEEMLHNDLIHPLNTDKSTFKKNKDDNKLRKCRSNSEINNILKGVNKKEIDLNNLEYIQDLFYKEKKGSEINDKENSSNSDNKCAYSSNDFSEEDTNSDDDTLNKNIIDPSIFENKLKIFNNLMESIKPSRSYNIDISHPLFNLLCKNENSYLSSNWHDRINFAFRNIWGLKDYIFDEKTEGEREKEFYNELEAFHMSSKIGACGLIYSLFLKNEENSNLINYFKKCFVRLSKENYPHIYKIYKPKFDDDLVFLFDSIVFTVILGSEKNNIDYNTARKIYSNDLKGKNVLCDCIFNLKNNSRFSIPIASQIDFMGIRVISEPLMPLSEEEIPIDVIKDILKNVNVNDYMSEEDKVFTPHRNNMNCDYDNSDIKDVHNNNENSENKKITKLKNRKEKIFNERMILEIENYDFSLYDQLKEMSNYVNFNCCILPFGLSNSYESKLFKKKNNVKIFRSIIDNLFVIRGTEEILPPFLFNFKKENFIIRMRYEFIKYYYERPLYNTALTVNIKCDEFEENKNNLDSLKEASKESLNNIDNYVIPKIINLITNFTDSYDITEAYHSHGINMCNLGYLLNKNKSPEFLSEIVCREIICRTLKCIYYEHVHSFLINLLKKTEHKKNINNYCNNNDSTYNNNACNKNTNKGFICCCKKCFTYWVFFPELVPHEFIIRLINLTLNINIADSLQFWKNILIPQCEKKFHINLLDHINIKEIEIYGLFLCIEYHFGICFKRECKKDYKVKLPLTLDDMSSFCSKKDKFLFPNVGKLKNIFKSNIIKKKRKKEVQNNKKKEHENGHNKSNDKENYSLNNLKGAKYTYNNNGTLKYFKNENIRKRINIDEEKINNLDNIIDPLSGKEKKLEIKNIYSLLEGTKNENISSRVSSQNIITGDDESTDNLVSHKFDKKYDKSSKKYYEKASFVLFYPKSNICFPKYSTWSYNTIEKLFSNTIIQEKFKIKQILKENIINIIDTKRNDFLNKNNICTVGSCSRIKSSIYEYNIPCHPYCILNENMKCINYYKAKKSILLLLNININKNVFELTKMFLYLAYLHFEHGYIKKCLKICYYIYNTIPNIGVLRRDILILILQCKVKEDQIDDALIVYKLIVTFSRFYDGEYNISTLLCNILLANYYYDKSNNVGNKYRNNNVKEDNLNNSFYIESIHNTANKDKNTVQKETKEEDEKEKGAKNNLDTIDHLQLKRKYLLKALYYSKECYRTIYIALNDIISHWIYISSLIMLGNVLFSLNQFQKAIIFYSLSLQYSIKGKMPKFIILQNKCLLADSLKNNGNFEKAVEIAEECLHSLDNSVSSSHNLTLYIIFRLAQMKQHMGCKDLICPNIYLDNIPNAHIKKKISLSDFIAFEKKYLDEKSAKYRKEAIDLYIKLYYRLKNKKNYSVVYGKDIYGNLYTKDDLSSTEDNKDSLEDDVERISIVIREILKIKVVSLSENKQLMLASKLLAIVLSKNSSTFVKELTLRKKGLYKDLLFKHMSKLEGGLNEKLQEEEKEKEEDDAIYNSNNQVNYINEIYINDYVYDKKNTDSILNFQLSDFYLNKQKIFFDRSCYTKEYDLISIEKILFDDNYFSIEDICKYCYLKCDKCNNQKVHENDFNSLLNPNKWFDLLFYNVMKGTYSHLQLLILIDLIRIFLSPLQKQLILFRIRALINVKDNEKYSEYMQYLLNNEENNILHLTNFLNHKKHFFVGDNFPEEFSNIHKKDVKKNIHFLSNITVTNPKFLTCPDEFKNSE